jgi:hypothetical protein
VSEALVTVEVAVTSESEHGHATVESMSGASRPDP